MAAGVRELRRRIRGFKNTQQITKAMKMVAAAKLLKAQERATTARPYAEKIDAMLRRVLAAHGAAGGKLDGTGAVEALMVERPVNKVIYVVLTSDRGLSGSYNANIIRLAEAQVKERQGTPTASIVPVGRKAFDYFAKRHYDIVAKHVPVGDEATFAQAKQISSELTALYTSGTADEVNLVYSEFVNAMTYRPTVSRLFPIGRPEGEAGDRAAAPAGAEVDYIYEPSGPEVLNALLPRYVQVRVFRALLEARASEHGARMTAMGMATDNASEMIERLTLDMNRARQAAITREIAEIVGGAEALK
ncbi:MAG: ATP synthase F1 subunit gamma [Bacillota bacterium]